MEGGSMLLLVLLLSSASAATWLGVFPAEDSADTDSFQTARLDDDTIIIAKRAGFASPFHSKLREDKRNEAKIGARPHRDAALLLDKLLYALRRSKSEENKDSKAMDKGLKKNAAPVDQGGDANNDLVAYNGGGMERRGSNANSKVYWRCYFNAVSCFK